MSKKLYRATTVLWSVLTVVCLLLGVAFVRGEKNTLVGSAELVSSTSWSNPTTEALTAKDDTETGYTHLSGFNNWGRRMYYNEKLTLDGLTVTIGSTNMVASSRFGFGFTNNAGGYTPESGPFNVTIVPSEYSGQDCMYFNNTHASGTIVYTADTFSVGVCTVDGSVVNRFISAPSSETRYSITFKYMGQFSAEWGDYWQATITLEKGNTFRSNLQGATIAFLESSLNGILDSNRQCYLSAFGMQSAGDFYIGITTAEEKVLLTAADSALSAYQTKKTSSAEASVVAEREAAVSAIAALPQKYQSKYQAQLLAIDQIDNTWLPAFNTCASATYDAESMCSNLNPTDYGNRIYYNKKVALDGLTVTMGSTNMVAGSRFGFGFTNNATGYTPESGPFNVTVAPSEYEGQNSVYFNSTHESGTIVYLTDTVTAGVCTVNDSVQNRFVSATSAETRYSVTFTYRGAHPGGYGNYWTAKITLDKGSTFAGLTSATVDFLDASLNGILDSNGECYISAFGMVSAGKFYVGVKTAEDAALMETVDATLEAYRSAIANGEDTTGLKEACVSAIGGLSANKYVSYVSKLTELEELEDALENVTQSVSVTISDTLSLNYKIDIPENCNITRTVLTSELRGETVEYTDVMIDEQGRYVLTTQNVTPQYLTEQIKMHFVAYDENNDSLIERDIVYSVQEYCETLLAESSDRELRTAVVDLLNYGTEAQKYVKANASNLANKNISAYQALATAFNANGATNVLAANQGSVVTFTAASLLLEDKVAVCAKFKTTADVSSLTATAQIGGGAAVDLEIESVGNNVYRVVLPGVSPLQYAENIIFKVYYNGSLNASCRYSVHSYVARKYGDASCGSLVKALYSYGAGISAYAAAANGTAAVNAIQDTFYENGLSIIAPDGSVTNTASTINRGATPSWLVGQWDSVGDLGTSDPAINNGVYTYADAAKTLSINTNTGAVNMQIKGSVEYADGDRSQVTTPWPHLLLQQDYYGDQLINLSQMSSLKMQMTYKVTHCDDKMQGKVDADNLHCAQVVWYITLQNRTENHAEYGEYMWFGMILYDNREEGSNFTLTYKVDDDSTANTGKMICQPASKDWSSTGKMAKVGETINVDFDILTIAKEAFNKAKKTYGLFSKSSWEDMYIGSMNFGIELPGTYDIGVEIDNVGLMYTKNA